jgi:hypothetical protein
MPKLIIELLYTHTHHKQQQQWYNNICGEFSKESHLAILAIFLSHLAIPQIFVCNGSQTYVVQREVREFIK